MPAPPVRIRLIAAALVFAAGCAAPDDATALRPGEQAVTFEVAAQTVPCMQMTMGECLSVREVPGERWRALPEGIEGFAHEPGRAAVVEVGRREVARPPADGFPTVYRLLREVGDASP